MNLWATLPERFGGHRRPEAIPILEGQRRVVLRQSSKLRSECYSEGIGAEGVIGGWRPPWPCSSSLPRSGWGSVCLSLCDICHHLAFGYVAKSNKPSVKDGGGLTNVDRLS